MSQVSEVEDVEPPMVPWRVLSKLSLLLLKPCAAAALA